MPLRKRKLKESSLNDSISLKASEGKEKIEDEATKETVQFPEEKREVSGELIIEVSEKRNYGWIFVVGILLAIVVVGGSLAFYYKGIKNIGEQLQSSAPTPKASSLASTPMPSKTPIAQALDKKKYTIEVLNGSGIGGKAAGAQELLVDGGFNVKSIGNADSSNNKETQIAAKSSVAKDFLNVLSASLSKNYVVASKTAVLNNSETLDVIITIGSETP